jgi:hypothetical protein
MVPFDRHSGDVTQICSVQPECWHMAAGRDVDEIGGDRRGRREGPRTPALQYDAADKVAFGDDGIVDPLDSGDRRRPRHHARMDALLEPVLCQPRDAEQLDAVAELFGEVDVEPRNVPDALRVDPVEIDRAAETDTSQDRQLVRGIDAVDVEARIGFGIAELLRFRQDLGEFVRALAHRRQDVVRGAVQDAVDALQPVAGETFSQPLDDRDAARDGGLECENESALLGPRSEPRPVMRHQCLVRRHDVLAMIEGGVEHLPCDAVGAADQLDDDVDLGIGRHRRGVLVPAHRREVGAPIAPAIACRDRADDDAAASALSQQVGLSVQQLEDAGPNSAETRDGDLEWRFHYSNPDAMCETQEPPPAAAGDPGSL